MTLSIKFIGALRHLSGKTHMPLDFRDGLTIKEIVDSVSEQIPELKRTFCDSDLNDARSNSLILVNGVEISVLNGYKTKVSDGDEIVFVPVVHGG